MSDVDFILNNWFGEPPEHSDNERTLTRHLYEPLREIERQRDQLLEALKALMADNTHLTLEGHLALAKQARAAIEAVEQ